MLASCLPSLLTRAPLAPWPADKAGVSPRGPVTGKAVNWKALTAQRYCHQKLAGWMGVEAVAMTQSLKSPSMGLFLWSPIMTHKGSISCSPKISLRLHPKSSVLGLVTSAGGSCMMGQEDRFTHSSMPSGSNYTNCWQNRTRKLESFSSHLSNEVTLTHCIVLDFNEDGD